VDDDLVIVCVDDEACQYLARRSHDRLDNDGTLQAVSTILLKTYDEFLEGYRLYLSPDQYVAFTRGPCPDCDGAGENCETCDEQGMLVSDEVWGEA